MHSTPTLTLQISNKKKHDLYLQECRKQTERDLRCLKFVIGDHLSVQRSDMQSSQAGSLVGLLMGQLIKYRSVIVLCQKSSRTPR